MSMNTPEPVSEGTSVPMDLVIQGLQEIIGKQAADNAINMSMMAARIKMLETENEELKRSADK